MNQLALEARALTKRFGKVVALDGLDLEIPPGGSVALLGDTAAGKSVALRCIVGLARPTSGSISVGGAAPTSRPGLMARRKVGYLAQEPGFYGWMKGRELLVFAADLLGLDRRSGGGGIDELIERVGLGGVADRTIAEYAPPLRQRLGLAQALVGDPELVLLDEPLGWLDPAGRSEMLELLIGLRGTPAMVIATSDVALAELVCERTIVLDHGRPLAASPTAALLHDLGTREYVLETEPGPGLALAGLAARLTQEAWVSDVATADGALRIAVSDDARADRELLPAVVATGLTVRAVRRERPAVGVLVERLRGDGT